MQDITIAVTAASYHGNKGAAAMLQSSIKQLHEKYGERLHIRLMSAYPDADQKLLPFKFVRVVSAKPGQVLFVAFPLAVLHWIFRWLPFMCSLISHNKIIRTYKETDVVLDEAGVAFVDARGFLMNTYAAVTMAVPLLLGRPVVKLAQTMGPFKSGYNRFLARSVLPRITLICARGKMTKRYLSEIGINNNVATCADVAFSMPDDPAITAATAKLVTTDPFFQKPFVTLSLSSVVDRRCFFLPSVDYRQSMITFVRYLNERGYGVLLVANAAREGTKKSRCNDIPLCEAVYSGIMDKSRIYWSPKEMEPEKIRELIARSEMLIGSRFHAMVAALDCCVPVLQIGWNHQYQEVLDSFGLADWAVDFKTISEKMLAEKFQELLSKKDEIEDTIEQQLPAVKESSRNNIRRFIEIADSLLELKKPR